MFRSTLFVILLLLTACAAQTTNESPTDVPDQPALATSVPGASLEPTSSPAAGVDTYTAAPGVRSGAVIVDDSFVTIYGEFENTGQHWLHNIQMVVTFFDAAGSEIYQDTVPTEILFAGPGERVPFYVVTDKARMQGAYASHKIEVTSIENDQPGYSLAVEFSDLGISGGIGEISGTVRHSGQGSCGYPTVAVAYYDAASKVVAVSSNYLETLSPGQEMDFKLLTMNLPADYERVEAWAACREIDGIPAP